MATNPWKIGTVTLVIALILAAVSYFLIYPIIRFAASIPLDPHRPSRSTPARQSTERYSIDYTRPRWERVSDGYAMLNIEVKNTGSTPIEFLKMEASFYDKSDSYLKSESLYIQRWQHLAPGDRSPSNIQIAYDPRIASVRLHFSCSTSEPFVKANVEARQVDRIQ